MKKLLSLFSILCVFMSVVACSSQSTPEAVTEQYAKNLKASDYDAIVKQFYFDQSSPEKAAKSEEQMKAIMLEKVKPEMDKVGGVDSYEIGEAVISKDGDSAKVPLNMVYGNGKTFNRNTELIKVGEKWYLSSGR
ncbi:MAG: DUF4878 domain-containing protein [Rikenellaceae bacterium]